MMAEQALTTGGDGTEYKVGDYVIYKKNGVCLISSIESIVFGYAEPREYFILHSAYDDKTIIYVPVDMAELSKHMRPIFSVEEVNDIISEAKKQSLTLPAKSKIRAKCCDEIISEGDRVHMLRLHQELCRRRNTVSPTDKLFYATDQRALNITERIIVEEFAYSLGIEKKEVVQYIIDYHKKLDAEA